MTISIEALLEQSQMSLLKASVEIVEKDAEIAALKEDNKLQAAQIAVLQCKLQRTVVPFHKRDDDERYRTDMQNAGRGHLFGG